MADSSRGVDPPGNRVGLVYDEKMCAHATPDGEDHPECPERIRAIWNKLQTTGVLDRCVILNTGKSEDTTVAINLVHSKNHVELIQRVSNKSFNKKRKRIANKFNSIYFNKGSSEAAYLAAGSVVKAVEQVASGELNSAFAVVRPPGHHAEEGEPMGFCLYNNVALATSYILNNRPDLGIAKILIVDWDVHHGNGTQKMFWKDSRVLFFSVHRHDNGTFYPGNDDGHYNMTGESTGIGYNINVPWEHGLCGDADYLAVWENVLIPVAKEFNPDLVIVSAGFDAAMHDPLGGCCVTPYGYSMMLRKLMDFADGKIVLALEGGYNLQSLANSVLACVQVLLDGKPISGSVGVCAFESTWRTIEAVRKVLKGYWPSLGKALAKNMMPQTTSVHQLFEMSSDSESEMLEDVFEDATRHLSDPSMNNQGVEEVGGVAVEVDADLGGDRESDVPPEIEVEDEEERFEGETPAPAAAPERRSKARFEAVSTSQAAPEPLNTEDFFYSSSVCEAYNLDPKWMPPSHRRPRMLDPDVLGMVSPDRIALTVVHLVRHLGDRTMKLEDEKVKLKKELAEARAQAGAYKKMKDDAEHAKVVVNVARVSAERAREEAEDAARRAESSKAQAVREAHQSAGRTDVAKFVKSSRMASSRDYASRC